MMLVREVYKDCKLFVLEKHESPDVEVYNNCAEDSRLHINIKITGIYTY